MANEKNSTIVAPILLDATGQEMVEALKNIVDAIKSSAISEYIKSISVSDNTLTITCEKDGKESIITYTPNLSGKVDKVTDKATIVYGVDGYKKQTTYPINVDANEWSVAYRGKNGTLYVASPQEDGQAVNKKYLEEQLAKVEVETIGLIGTLDTSTLAYSGTLTAEQFNKLISNKNLLLTIQVNGNNYAQAFDNCRMYDISNKVISSTCSFIDGNNNETKYSLYIDGNALTFKGGIIATDLSAYRTAEEQNVIDSSIIDTISNVAKNFDNYRTAEEQNVIDEKIAIVVNNKLNVTEFESVENRNEFVKQGLQNASPSVSWSDVEKKTARTTLGVTTTLTGTGEPSADVGQNGDLYIEVNE